jgi:hypothetical protein
MVLSILERAGARGFVRGLLNQLLLEAWKEHRGACPPSGYEGD